MKRLMALLVSALLILAIFTGCTKGGNVSTSDDGKVNGTNNATESTGSVLDTVVDDLSEMGDDMMTDATEDQGITHRSGTDNGGSSGTGRTGSGNTSGNGSGSGRTGRTGRTETGSGSGTGSGMGA